MPPPSAKPLAGPICALSRSRKNISKSRLGQITKAGDNYLRSLLVMGARAILSGLGDKQDGFSRWARSLVERRGYWKAVVAIAAKNARLAWAVLHYGEDFRLHPGAA